MTDKPTDTEIDAFVQVCREKGMWELAIFQAVLDKWGQPAHSGEPVAWAQASIADWRRHQSEKVVKLTREAQHEYGFIQPLYTAQPVEREPLTDERIRSMCAQPWVFDTVKQWVRITEAAHGIKKGGQHGTE